MPRKPSPDKRSNPAQSPKGLSPRHAAFVDCYMVNYNATRAAKECGYSAKSAYSIGSEILNKPEVQAEITRRRQKLAENLHDISEERIKLELARCGLANMGDYMSPGEDGTPRLNFRHLTRDQSAALQEVTVEEFKDGRSDYRHVRRVKFKLVDKRGSLELLAKTKGMLVEKVDHSHKHQGLIMHALLQEIDEAQRGKPIVDVLPPPPAKDDAA